MQDKFVPAETFFEAAVTFQPDNILAWTMFGLYVHLSEQSYFAISLIYNSLFTTSAVKRQCSGRPHFKS